jgi:hypothetical protein
LVPWHHGKFSKLGLCKCSMTFYVELNTFKNKFGVKIPQTREIHPPTSGLPHGCFLPQWYTAFHLGLRKSTLHGNSCIFSPARTMGVSSPWLSCTATCITTARDKQFYSGQCSAEQDKTPKVCHLKLWTSVILSPYSWSSTKVLNNNYFFEKSQFGETNFNLHYFN